MIVKKMIRFLPILAIIFVSCFTVSLIYAKGSSLQSQLLDHVGKSYTGSQDPSYLSYDLALREVIASRINKRFGIALDTKTYSGFDLLEIESLFKCKKTEESFDIFLKMFPKNP